MALTKIGKEGITGISNSSDANAITIDSSENVGIGTSSPSFESGTGGGLEINNSSGNGSHIKLTDSASGSGGTNGFDLYAFNTSGYIENYEAGSIVFRNNGSERMRILSSGGITFNGDTATANALDDYEEGTASLSTGTGSVTIIYATYTKIGRLVTVRCGMYNFTDRTTAQPIQINGLPFTSSSTNQSASGVLHRYFNGGGDQVVTYIGTSSNRISLYQNTANGNYQEVNHNHLSSTSSAVYLTVSYETS